MLERLDFSKRLDACVDLKVVPGFDEEFKGRIKDEDAVAVFNHQTHADGILASIAVNHLLKLAEETDRKPKLKGFVLTVARSLVEGHQSRIMQGFYFPISFLMSRKGLRTVSYTRKADEVRYGISRNSNKGEIAAIHKELIKGYGLAIFPEGGVQGGRHIPGDDPENIFGMQEVTGTVLLNAARLTKMANGHRPIFYVTVGLHGGFRLQSPNKEMFGPTKAGLATLFGAPEELIPHVRGEGTLGGIISESTLAERFGRDWMRTGLVKGTNSNGNHEDCEQLLAINRFIMEDVSKFVPPQARGVYALKREEAVLV